MSDEGIRPDRPAPVVRARLFSRRKVIVALLGCLTLAGGEYWYLHQRQEEQAVALANEVVAAKMEAARAHMARDHWNEAILALTEARAAHKATTHDQIDALLTTARQGQAAALLQAAEAAVAGKDAAAALRLLREYLDHPNATQPERATRLRDEIERAVSREKAVALLAGLSDDDLALFAEQGQLAETDDIRTEGVREIFKDTLRKNLDREQQKRQAKRDRERLAAERLAAERARQVARLRDTPAFRGLIAFVARTRAQHREREELARRQKMAMAQLFRQLNVNDPAEQEKIRADLEGRGDTRAIIDAVDKKRAEVKRAYRDSADFNPADRALFDQLVDQELDALLKEMKPETVPPARPSPRPALRG
jgi:hypothetical protein